MSKTIENKIIRCADLKREIKTLEAEFKMLKDQLIFTYFDDNPVYVNNKGLTLATYEGYEKEFFRQSDFKEAKPELYKKFVELKTIKTFLIK